MFFPTHKHQLQQCVSQVVPLSGCCRLSGGGSLRQSQTANTSQTQVRWDWRPEGEREIEEGMERQQRGGLLQEKMTDRKKNVFTVRLDPVHMHTQGHCELTYLLPAYSLIFVMFEILLFDTI